jgi:hypothetical protein
MADSRTPHWEQNTASAGALTPQDSHARIALDNPSQQTVDCPFHSGIDSPTLRPGALALVSRRRVQKKDTG